MLNFLEDFLSLGNPRPKCALYEIKIEFVEDKNQILDHAERCKQSRGVLGIYSPSLGKGMILSTVEAIYKLGADTLIELKPYHYKNGLQRATTVSMKEISCICPFNQLMY
jgi:hypothetical protein